MELEYQIIIAMAKEISELRQDHDLEWGNKEDPKSYDIKNIIKEYQKSIKKYNNKEV